MEFFNKHAPLTRADVKRIQLQISICSDLCLEFSAQRFFSETKKSESYIEARLRLAVEVAPE
jgi:hypothetical protein